MAAMSTPASAAHLRNSDSDTEVLGRRLSGKSGKSFGLANHDDYKWIEGNYTIPDPANGVVMRDGTPFSAVVRGTGLEIKALDGFEGLVFQATLVAVDETVPGGEIYYRDVFEGVASYNLDNKITFYCDHIEYRLGEDGDWSPGNTEAGSDVGVMTCSKLAKVKSGKSIVCDTYSNDIWPLPEGGEGHFEIMSSIVWTDVTDDEEEAK